MYVKFAVMSMILQWAIRITESLPELPLRIFRIPGAVRNVVPAKMNSLQKIDKSIRQVKIMRSAILLTVIVSGILFSGCGTWREAQANVEKSKNLRIGMTKGEVLAVMGDPLDDELFCKPDVWYYFIEPVWVDGLVTEDECMPLVFAEGKLIGWGRVFYTTHRLRSRDNARELVIPGEKTKEKPAEKNAAAVPETAKEPEKTVKQN